MQQRLTIDLDAALIARAKRYARAHGVPLSTVIEASLREALPPESSSFSGRWRGQFQPANRNDVRYEALARKYL